MHSSTMDDMITSKCATHLCYVFANHSISAKYGQPDPERAAGILEGMEASREGTSDEGSSGQAAIASKADKQA